MVGSTYLRHTFQEKGKPAPEPFRLSSDHELANRIKAILVKGNAFTVTCELCCEQQNRLLFGHNYIYMHFSYTYMNVDFAG